MDARKRGESVNPNPMDKANLISRLFFWWLNPLLREGYKRTLTMNDIFDVRKEDDATALTDDLERLWNSEIKKKRSTNRQPSFMEALFLLVRCRMLFVTFLVFIEEALRVVRPILVGQLVLFFAPNSDMTVRQVCFIAAGIVLCSIAGVIVHHNYYFHVDMVGVKLRVATAGLLYRKALRLSTAALGDTASGQIVNLVSNDVSKFTTAVRFAAYIIVAPIQLIVVMGLLWYHVGPSVLIGLVVFILFTPVQSIMGKVFSKLRLKMARLTDDRVHIMSEFIAGMRIIKFYCWEKPFSDIVAEHRSQELTKLWRTRRAELINCTPTFIPRHLFVMLTIISIKIIANLPLSASFLFTIVALAETTMWSITGYLPNAVMYGSQGTASCKRIQRFLMLTESVHAQWEDFAGPCLLRSSLSNPKAPELKPLMSQIQPEAAVVPPEDVVVTMVNVSAHWPSRDPDCLAFESVSISIKSGELLAVVGPVGAGKSSLLMAILEECPIVSGSLLVRGKIAYVSQQAWIFSASIRQNILFGQNYDKKRYTRVLELCALTQDISHLPHGDLSLVGERGVALSGGQRARLSLARALYVDAQIFLLDDPLSAVDATVSKHLFEKCIKGHLNDRAVILITHQLQYLERADRILVLKDGKSIAEGTFDELNNCGMDFTELLKCYEEEDITQQNCISKPATDVAALSFQKEAYHAHEGDANRKWPISTSLTSLYGSAEYIHVFTSASVGNVDKPSSHHDILMSALSLHDEDHSASRGRLDHHMCDATEETRKEGSISWRVYTSYMLSGANVCTVALVFLLIIVSQTSYVMTDWFLSYWADEEEKYSSQNQTTSNNETSGGSYLGTAGYRKLTITNLYILLGIFGFMILVTVAMSLCFHKVCIQSSQQLHNRMFNAVVRAPMRFFDTNPLGRILNRFSKDVSVLDEALPIYVFEFLTWLLYTIALLIITVVVNPWILLVTAPLLVALIFARHYYIATSRAIKRLEGTANSPVFSHLSATLEGLYTVRAFKSQKIFISEFANHQNLHTGTCFLFVAASRWLATWLDWLCVVFVSAVIFLCIATKDQLGSSAGSVGLMITYSIFIMDLFQWVVRMSTEVENVMTSVERVLEYCHIPSEAAWEGDCKPPPGWPSLGAITFKGASLKYQEAGPLVLKDLTLDIKPAEKVGIVGRTGAGKSSILTMLFRICEPTGTVLIDGVDVLKLGLHDLRSKISIIPQDPVLFGGSVRYNLDPFKQHRDQDIWDALRQVELYSVIENLPGGLETKVMSGGVNFSIGQRQLLCLARAILGHNKILVIDEATANVDLRTDSLIQQTIRDSFQACTVLTIAHRLLTIMDSDRVLVLEDGQVKEFDHPYTLLSNRDSLLYSLASTMGQSELLQLKAAARSAFLSKSADQDPAQLQEDSAEPTLEFS